MAHSKWNRRDSILVNRLTDEERREAFHEWSEGCEELEKFLWNCFENGVETSGCCKTGCGSGSPYVDFRIETSKPELLKRFLSVAEQADSSQTLIMLSARNVFCGPNWYCERLLVDAQMSAEEFFEKLNIAFSENSQESGCYHRILEFYDFFKGKGSDPLFRFRKEGNDGYCFTIEIDKVHSSAEYFKKLYYSTELKNLFHARQTEEDLYCEYNCATAEEMNQVIDKTLAILKDEWNWVAPIECTQDMELLEKALIMRQRFGNSRKGVEKLNEFINANKEPSHRAVHY